MNTNIEEIRFYQANSKGWRRIMVTIRFVNKDAVSINREKVMGSESIVSFFMFFIYTFVLFLFID